MVTVRFHSLLVGTALLWGLCHPPTLAASSGVKPRLLGVTFSGKQLIEIDPDTGAGTLVGSLPAYILPHDLAVEGGRLRVFSNPLRLHQIDARTAQPVATNEFDVVDLCDEDGCGGEGALAFGPDGSGYVSWSTSTGGTLASFRLQDGSFQPITPEGALMPSMDGMAFSDDGLLFGMDQGASPSLYRINPTTGSTSLVGSHEVTLAGATVAGLTFSPDGTLFAALGNTSVSMLYRVNTSTGRASVVGPIGFPRVSGLAFYTPPPGPLALDRELLGLRLAWPHEFGGRLQSTFGLGQAWFDTSFEVETNGNRASVLVAPTFPRAWFRLAR